MNFKLSRYLKRLLPRRLFARSLIIIVTPMLMLQGAMTYGFFWRHYNLVTKHLAEGVAADVGYLITIRETRPPGKERDALIEEAARSFDYQVSFMPGDRLTAPYTRFTSIFTNAINEVFARQFGETHRFTSQHIGKYVDLKVQMKDGVLRFMIPHDLLIASNADIFILWMVGSSLVLIAVAILFLRNQVRPIERLAFAAEAFGKGQSVPGFKPYGAAEVRRAAQAFLTMRGRIERYVQQRTEMLAGVSHDLKTPLTRLKLQLAMLDDSIDTAALREDVGEMEHMLDEYLEFARGESGEDAEAADVSEVVKEAAAAAVRARADRAARLKIDAPEPITLPVKRNALKRCAANLIDNALKHGEHVAVSLVHNGRFVEIVVDDDGPGIPEERREEAFRPFHRLDQGRNLQTGGVGLGLAIARDIARAHGGELALADSAMGGLRAAIRLPV
jgi:two-component system, OmpR family, osmolarity sensor histidine kinase EnvZ